MPREKIAIKASKRKGLDVNVSNKINKNSNRSITQTLGKDLDGNGFVDGSEKIAYQLYNSGNPIVITKKSEQIISDKTSQKWSAYATVPAKNGHLVLVTKNRSKKNNYSIWKLNKRGIIRSKSRWLSGSFLSSQGYEEVFATDLSGDGIIEGHTLIDAGDARYVLSGTATVGQQLRVLHDANDPDGDGRPLITWQFSSGTAAWKTIGIRKTLKVPAALDGSRIRAKIDYTDGDGFKETIFTKTLNIPYVDDGDAAFLIQGSPAVGQTLSIQRSNSDPDGDGTPNISWFQSTDGVNWSLTSSSDTFTIPAGLEGRRITATVNYNDAQGFGESIDTDSLNIPYVDDGDAAFLIQGSPAVGQTLSIQRSNSDPDGDGDGEVEISWQASLDGISWWEVSTSDQLAITSQNAGHQLIAVVQYTDGQGFKESIVTESVSVPGVPGVDPDSNDDYGDSPSSAGLLTVNNTTSGELEDVGDRDWFAVDLTAGVRYQFDLSGASLEDPFLYLRNASSSLVDYNDDKLFTSLDSQITFTAETSGIHYLDVGSYNDIYTGTYSLSATALDAPTPGFSPTDGFGHVNAQRAFEQLLGVSLDTVDALGGNLWGLDNINAPEVWGGGSTFAGTTGRGTTIAVIDTGVDLDHPEFSGRLVAGYDFVDDDTIADDGNGHGTHVAGTIAGANDGNGITGVAFDADIMPLRVLGDEGYGWTQDIISAVRWAADNGADVINMSLGGSSYSQAMADAISYASGRGSVVVMAAGNSGGSSPDYPAAHAINHGIAVGAVDRNRSLAGFSNQAGSTELDYVTAPGVSIYSAVPGGGYATFNGSSMAAPHVAGVAGLLKSHDRSLSPSAVEDLLTGSASNATGSGSLSGSLSSAGSSGAVQSADLISLQTLENFTQKQLKGTLIGSLEGNARKRLSTIRDFEGTVDGVRHFDVVDSSRNSVAVLELSRSKAVDRIAILNDLLSSDQFNYFEIDQQFSIV